eukprot:2267316-Rhodomonas_salina.1
MAALRFRCAWGRRTAQSVLHSTVLHSKIPRQKQYWDCYADASGVATDQVHNLRVQSFYTFPGSSISFVSIAQPELD